MVNCRDDGWRYDRRDSGQPRWIGVGAGSQHEYSTGVRAIVDNNRCVKVPQVRYDVREYGCRLAAKDSSRSMLRGNALKVFDRC